MTLTINKTKLQEKITAIFVFILLVDATDYLFGLKMPLFLLLVLICAITYSTVLKSFIAKIILIYGCLVITSCISFFASFDIDPDMAMFLYKTFLMTFLLLWIDKLHFFEKITCPAVLISCIVIFIYITMLAYPELEAAIFSAIYNSNEGIPINMSRRSFVGIELTAVYYKSSILFFLPMAVYYYKMLTETFKLKNLIIFLLLFSPLIIGGTRANILSAVAVIGILSLIRLSRTQLGKQVVVLLTIAGIIGCYFVLSALLTDKGEPSLTAKTSLLHSWCDLIVQHPMILVWGQGAGATFFTEVRGLTSLTEWTYLELIRWFGIPISLLIIGLYLYPFYLMYRKRKSLPYQQPLSIAFLFYLLIAGTNPLLLSSTGMLALLTMYSYALNPNYEVPKHETNRYFAGYI